jgi:hypothetical protein
MRVSRAVAEATAPGEAWLERVRAGLVALLGFFDDEPSVARTLVLDAAVNPAVALECRQRLYRVLASLLNTDGAAAVGAPPAGTGPGPQQARSPALTAELVVGGVFSVIRSSMLESDGRKLVELAPCLMAFIAAPYLGQAAARAELEGRSSEDSESLGNEARGPGRDELARAAAIFRAAELPIRATHRTTLVLRAIARAPYSNNREVAQAAGLADEGQASKLLARLESRGVIENVGVGAARGEPNAWLLTPSGQRAVELLGKSSSSDGRQARTSRARGMA